MTNLLPPEEKEKIRAAYRKRVFTTTLFLFSFLTALSFAELLPVYAVLSSQNAAVRIAKDSRRDASRNAKDLEETAREANRLAKILLGNKDDISARGVLLEILSRKPKEIRITGFLYEDGAIAKKNAKNIAVRKIVVSGFAETRDGLLSFLKTLKGERLFASAELPISNFVKDRNLDFSINIALSDSDSDSDTDFVSVSTSNEGANKNAVPK